MTEGLDGLRERLEEYAGMGARFAKWRAVITIGDGLPTRACVVANAHALARYAALCQVAGIVPIVEPEVLMAEEVAAATVGVLRQTVPAAVPGIAFLSGGQPPAVATANLQALQGLGAAALGADLLVRPRAGRSGAGRLAGRPRARRRGPGRAGAPRPLQRRGGCRPLLPELESAAA